MCGESVPIMYICEELVPIFHARVKVAHLSKRAMPPSSVGQHFQVSPQSHSQLNSNFGLHCAVGNVSSYRCVSEFRSMGRKLDPDPVPYFYNVLFV